MKKIIVTALVTFTVIVAMAQNYEAANWKILLLDNPKQISIGAAPLAPQSNAELQLIKQAIANKDEKRSEAIKY